MNNSYIEIIMYTWDNNYVLIELYWEGRGKASACEVKYWSGIRSYILIFSRKVVDNIQN